MQPIDNKPTVEQLSQTKKPLTPTKEHPLQDLSDKHRHSKSDDSDVLSDTADDDNDDDKEIHNIDNKMDTTDDPMPEAQNDENKNIILCSKEEDESNNIQSTSLSSSDSLNEGVGIVKTSLPPGKVVRRKKTANSGNDGKVTGNKPINYRASFPLAKSVLSKSVEKLEAQMRNLGSETDSSERLEHHDAPVPDWVVSGESVLIRPYNTSGVISFVGPTHFQVNFKIVFLICTLN